MDFTQEIVYVLLGLIEELRLYLFCVYIQTKTCVWCLHIDNVNFANEVDIYISAEYSLKNLIFPIQFFDHKCTYIYI